MPIERAPYLIYSEQVSTVNYLNQTGADVVAILAPTKFAKLTSAGAIETETVEGETSTKWYEPTIAEDEILIFNRYSIAEQMVQSEELKKVLKVFFLENSTGRHDRGHEHGQQKDMSLFHLRFIWSFLSFGPPG